MILHVTALEHLGGFRMRLAFNDGRSGEVEYLPGLRTAWTEPLYDPAFHARARLNAECGVVEWPNDFDVAPEYLYFLAFKEDPALHDQFVAWGFLAEGQSEVKTAA